MAQTQVIEARGRVADRKFLLLVVSALSMGGMAALLVLRYRLLGGVLALIAAVTLLAGTPPRVSGRARRFFTARLLDRAFDFCLLASLAWASRTSNVRLAILALLGLGASYLASYEYARGRALGYRASEGAGFRATKMSLLAAGLLSSLTEAALWIFLALAVSASVVRALNIGRQERRSSPSPPLP